MNIYLHNERNIPQNVQNICICIFRTVQPTHEMRDEVQSSFPSVESEDRFLAEREFRVILPFPLK